MEKPTTTSKSKSRLFKLLRKAIRNLPLKNKKSDDGVVQKSIVPINKTAADGGQMVKSSSFGEPISPKISCMGQIKYRKKVSKHIHLFLHKEMCPAIASRNKGVLMKPAFFLPEAEKIPSNMRNTHNNNNNGFSEQMGGRKSSFAPSRKAPCLNQMKKFASFHGGELSDFDWKSDQIGLDDYTNESKYYYSDYEEEEEEKEELKGPFSGPLIWVGGTDYEVEELEPRKEVNLWKRRTIDQLKPLHIRSPCTSLNIS